MPLSNSSQTRLSLVTETTWGTTPTSPSFTKTRVTGESLRYDAQTATSNELTDHRNVTDVIKLGEQASGGFNMELSYATFDDLLESALYGAWSSDVLKNAATEKSFTIEKLFELGATDAYLRYTGMIVDTFSLTAAAQSIVTGSFGFMGKGGAIGDAALAGATYAEPNDNDVLSASEDFAALTVEGLSPQPCILEVTLQTANNLRAQPAVGDTQLCGIGFGQFVVTGSIRAYFESKALYEQYLNNTESGLQFTVGAVTNEKYTFDVPRLKFTNGDVFATGPNQDVVADMTYQGLYDTSGSPANNATLIVTRAVA